MSFTDIIPFPQAATPAEFAANLDAVRVRIAAAAARAGREASEIELLPVSKTVPQERLRAAIAAGCTTLGENKVQEAVRKHDELADLPVRWSLIGHLQRNKAKDVAAIATEFHAGSVEFAAVRRTPICTDTTCPVRIHRTCPSHPGASVADCDVMPT